MAQDGSTDNGFIQSARWLSDHWPQLWPTLLNVAGIVSLGLVPAGWALLIPAVLLAAANIKLLMQTPIARRLDQHAKTLEQGLEDANEAYYSLYEEYLSSLSELLNNKLIALYRDTLGLSARERVTVYRYRYGSFLLAARYSRHPEYTKAGRDLYPDDQGCLAHAWRDGSAFADDLPDPMTNEQDYIRQQLHWGLDEATIRQMRMKGRNYAAYAVENSEGTNNIGVIVFESTRPNTFSGDELRLIIQKAHREIADLLERASSLDTSMDYAAEEGY